MEALKNGEKRSTKQTDLNGIVQKVSMPGEFTRAALRHAVTRFIACDDQVSKKSDCAPQPINNSLLLLLQSLAVANKAMFRNCLVAMRPKTTNADVPTTHDVMSHLHNEFVGWLQELKADIEVLESITLKTRSLTFQAAPGLISTTADGWSVDTTKASFLGVTAHWVDVRNGKWMLRAEVVGFRGISGEHSGANLGRYFLGVCERVGIVNAQRSKVNTYQM
jgi:hypothetical protein